MPFTSLRCTITVPAAALFLGACTLPPTLNSNTLTSEERARVITAISHFMSDGDADDIESVSKGFSTQLYETQRNNMIGTISVTYRGFQRGSNAFSIKSTYRQDWKYERHQRPVVSSNVDLVMSNDFCLTRDEFAQGFGSQVDRNAGKNGKYSGLATSKNIAMVTFTDDGSCVKAIYIFARRETTRKPTVAAPQQ